MRTFWIAAAIASVGAHVSAAVWINGHEPPAKTVRPPITMELGVVPPPAPAAKPEPPPPPPPPPRPPKQPVLVKKVAAKIVPPAYEAPPPAAPKVGISDDATTPTGEIAVASGVTTDGQIGTGTGADKTIAPEPVGPAVKPTTASGKKFVPIYQVTRIPKAKYAVPPEIPDAFRDAQREALVVIEVEIDAQGHVTGARVIRHADFGLDDAALAAARATEFEPALMGSQPVAVRYQIPYRFKVRG